MSMSCSKCGGEMIGDGFTVVFHCENADYETYYDKAPDDLPVLCLNTENGEDHV